VSDLGFEILILSPIFIKHIPRHNRTINVTQCTKVKEPQGNAAGKFHVRKMH